MKKKKKNQPHRKPDLLTNYNVPAEENQQKKISTLFSYLIFPLFCPWQLIWPKTTFPPSFSLPFLISTHNSNSPQLMQLSFTWVMFDMIDISVLWGCLHSHTALPFKWKWYVRKTLREFLQTRHKCPLEFDCEVIWFRFLLWTRNEKEFL